MLTHHINSSHQFPFRSCNQLLVLLKNSKTLRKESQVLRPGLMSCATYALPDDLQAKLNLP